ncbi:unnamed protein product [Paramecium sonneborni]|uniref:Uncharacterized protein n=1 Tax=Paramecium sonneborni TaxID=65129 RepID=A0A8S1PVX7_9CILI|nr:unnamed protein product [Paramecium sonneborni]
MIMYQVNRGLQHFYQLEDVEIGLLQCQNSKKMK